MIGLEKGIVRLAPFSEEWKHIFEAESALLHTVIGRYILGIQHVGSTSIPGMLAKPIIDIAIAVSDYEEAKVCIEPIETLGYEYKGEFGIPRRHYFVKGDPRTFHIHICEVRSQEWVDLLFFRDHLSQHPNLAQEYASLKLQLATIYPQDRTAYLEGKAPFIQCVLQIGREGDFL
jgi:GrpB-like predicted nucleotidyltransferase (UPF0157 family)